MSEDPQEWTVVPDMTTTHNLDRSGQCVGCGEQFDAAWAGTVIGTSGSAIFRMDCLVVEGDGNVYVPCSLGPFEAVS